MIGLKKLAIFNSIAILVALLVFFLYYSQVYISDKKEITLSSENVHDFNWYNTNGSLPFLKDGSAFFYGSNMTNVYSDAVSFNYLKIKDYLVLDASIAVNIESFSNYSKEDHFAIFATNDKVKYEREEFGFMLPENDNMWYAY
ncbi:MAG TPA: hypothetical protein VJ343_03460, partial [archaeon]|nr:hypothetical protein [archaeon]